MPSPLESQITQASKDVMDKEQKLSDMSKDTTQMAAPYVKLTVKDAKKLVDSLNVVLKLFDADMLEAPTEDIDGPLPEDIMSAMMMIQAALQDSGLDDTYDLDVGMLEDATGLSLIIGTLSQLSKDKNFSTFLKSAPESMQDTDMEAKPEQTPAAGMPEDEDEDMNKMFMSRA